MTAPTAGSHRVSRLVVMPVCRECLLRPRTQACQRHRPDLPIDHPTAVHDHQCRNGASLEPGRYPRCLVDVDFRHLQSTGQLAPDLLNSRTDHSARSAPRSPQVDQYRHRAPVHDGVEILVASSGLPRKCAMARGTLRDPRRSRRNSVSATACRASHHIAAAHRAMALHPPFGSTQRATSAPPHHSRRHLHNTSTMSNPPATAQRLAPTTSKHLLHSHAISARSCQGHADRRSRPQKRCSWPTTP